MRYELTHLKENGHGLDGAGSRGFLSHPTQLWHVPGDGAISFGPSGRGLESFASFTLTLLRESGHGNLRIDINRHIGSPLEE